MNFNIDFYHPTSVSLMVILALMAFYAMGLARLAKIYGPPTIAHAVPAVTAFVVYHWHFWNNPGHNGELWATYILAGIAMLAFLFGTSILCTGVMKLCGQELCINKEHMLIRLIAKLPLKMEGKSLCGISWLAAILLIFTPPLAAILAIFAILAALLVCGFTGQNVIAYAREIMELDGWPYTEVKLTKNGHWKGPSWYIVIAAVVACLAWGVVLLFTNATFVTGLLFVLRWVATVLGGFTIVCALCIAYIKLVTAKDERIYDETVSGKQYPELEFKRELVNDDWNTVGSFALSPLAIMVYFYQIFHQRFCPKLNFVSGEEFVTRSDSDQISEMSSEDNNSRDDSHREDWQ